VCRHGITFEEARSRVKDTDSGAGEAVWSSFRICVPLGGGRRKGDAQNSGPSPGLQKRGWVGRGCGEPDNGDKEEQCLA